MQEDIKKAQQEINQSTFYGQAGGSIVKVSVSGTQGDRLRPDQEGRTRFKRHRNARRPDRRRDQRRAAPRRPRGRGNDRRDHPGHAHSGING
ncbi:MAG: YbaB/EbfC family nucleoid-associated protein [Desulfomicrobium escambiense]|nr:YbaB/EbfC family nucleoid-associated protein [Desulfomicrobium escambiense]